jgi:hypothetical protein
MCIDVGLISSKNVGVAEVPPRLRLRPLSRKEQTDFGFFLASQSAMKR